VQREFFLKWKIESEVTGGEEFTSHEYKMKLKMS
jgi:hypothetical protein